MLLNYSHFTSCTKITELAKDWRIVLKWCKQISLIMISRLIATKSKVSGNIDTVVVVEIGAAAAKVKLS